MNQKELNELRRRWKPDKNAISRIYGCFVNSNKEIMTDLDESLGMMTQEEAEKYLSLLKKALSGALGKNLIDIVFSTQQVMTGEEHRMLMELRTSGARDARVRQAFYQKVIQSLDMGESNYLLLLASDSYDVPHRNRDALRAEGSDEVFSYILCAVCPVKTGKTELGYFSGDNEFHCAASQTVAAPELGFLFPAFDDRSTNLYNALYYNKNAEDVHEDFIAAVFATQPPMPAALQKETFREVLTQALEEECSYDVVQAVHDQLCGLMEEHKENHVEEPLVVGKTEVRQALAANGVTQERMDAFSREYDQAFGTDAQLTPRNLVDPKQVELKTADVTIKVSPDRGDLVQTRIINGVKYIMIRVEEGVELNGVPVQIQGE